MKEETNLFLYGATFSVNLLSFSAGSSFSWPSPVLPKLASNDSAINPLPSPLSTAEESWIASIMLLGSIVGSLLSGASSEKLGRKKTLILFSIPSFVSYVMFAVASTTQEFLVGRFLLGISTGCAFAVIPSYIGELAEDSNRGFLGGVMSWIIGIGHLCNYMIGPFVSIPVLSYLNLIPLFLFYITFINFVPESPYHFIALNDEVSAAKSLRQLRNIANVENELLYIKNYERIANEANVSIIQILCSPVVVRGLLVSCGLLVFQQLSGIGAILSYMQIIFEASGSSISPYWSTVIVGLVQVTAVACSTFFVDRLGRKPLLLISASGVSVSLAILGLFYFLQSRDYDLANINWLPVSCLLLFIIGFNLGYAALPWTITGEIFSPNVKSLASSISTGFCLVSAFLITLLFPFISLAYGMAGSFWIFAAFSVIGLIFTAYVVPETKGRSLQEIQSVLQNAKEINF